jgi:hypothetical protein
MKSVKVFGLIITAIALFPAASFADNVSGKTQETNLDSTTIGHGNVSVTETKQSILELQQAGQRGTNVGGTSQLINGNNTTIGDGNIKVKRAAQDATSLQQTK